MAAKGKSGNDTTTGTAGNDHLNGGARDDVIHGRGGNDRINGGAGNDVLDGGSGNDIVSGDSGNDILVYDLSENVGSTDVYDGGSHIDTLQLVMTREEWQSPAVQADIARYLAFLAQVTHPVNGQANNTNFTFSFGLIASKFENIRIIVDGVEIDPRDQAVTLVDDVMTAGEDSASVAVDVLLNDSVPDLIGSLTNTQPAHGSVTLTRTSGAPVTADTASFVYTPDATHWQYLAAGETATDTFTYTVTDSDGDVQTATVTITITGSNDAPTLTAVVSNGAVVEDGAVTASGAIGFADADLSDSHTVSSSADGSGYLGTFTATITDDGAGDGAGSVTWDFSVDNAAIQYLAEGETLTQTYTVTVDDGQGGTVDQTVTVTITGTNDAPVVTAADSTGAILEDSAPQVGTVASETLVVAEAPGQGIQLLDRADLRIAPNPELGDDGQPSLSVAGEISALGEADSYQLTLVAGEIITLDIDGAAGFGAGGSFGLDAEVLVYDSNGVLVNLNDDAAITSGGGGSNFSQDSYLQFVAPGDGVYTIVVRSYGDYSTGPYTLQVSVDSTSIATLSDTGVVSFADVDLSDVHDVTVTANGTDHLGQLTAVVSDASTGDGGGQVTWTYEVGNADIQYLAAGETRVESFTLTVNDGQGGTVEQVVEVTVTGTNDAPVITSDQIYRTLFEDGDASTTGVMTFADVDLADGHTVAVTPLFGGYVGTFVANVADASTGDGSGAVNWTFNVDPAAIQYLSAGQGLQQRYSISVDDGNGGTTEQLVIITIRGTNDVPTITAAVETGAVVEDVTTNATGEIAFADVDLRDGHLVSSSAEGGDYLGSFNAWVSDASFSDGAGTVTWDFSVDPASVQHLAEGETLTQTYTVTVNDRRGGTVDQTVTVTITGANDAPTITSATSSGAVVEDGAVAASGAIAFADVELLDSHSVTSQANGAGYLGTFTASVSDPSMGDGEGSVTWDFSVDNAAIQYLAAGETLTQSYTVTVDDGNGGTVDQTVTVTITGTNDAPTVTASTSSGAVVEDGVVAASGAIAFADVDLRDGHSVSTVAGGTGYLGTFTATITDDGAGDGSGSVAWDFAVDNAATQYLAVGETLTQTYTVVVDDGQGGTVSKAVTITITGTNDAPVVQDVTGTATEDGAPVTVAFSADDADSDDDAGSLSYTITSDPAEGSVVNNGNGTFSFDPGADFQNLAAGETREITFGYEATDAHGASTPGSVTITVTGTNDAPVTGDVEMGGTSVGAGFPLVFGGYYSYAAYNQDSGEVVFSLIDTNGDGIVDAPGSSSELPGQGQGQAYYDYHYGLAVGDVDGDGDIDVVVATQQGLVSYTNVGDTNGDGQANFVRSVLTNTFAGYDVALGDLDGDDRLDVVASRYNTLTELLNTGDANGDGLVNDFAARTVATGAQGNGYGITTADMNGDGLTDVIVANYYQGPNQILLNLGDTDGDGQVNYRVQNLNGAYNTNGLGVITGDIDGDGDLDLLVSRWGGQNEVVYINDGDPDGDGLINFRTIELPTGGNTLESELIDIDGDGDLDVVSSELSGNARIAYNQGDTNGDGLVEFSIQNVTGASSNYGVAVGDVDGDGDLDIVFPSLGTNGAVYLQNQGDTDGDGQINFARVALTGVDASWDAEFTRIGGGGGGSGAYEDGPVVIGAFDGDDVDSDDDGASLTYTITSAPSEGSVVNNGDGTFGFSPGEDFQDLAQGEFRTVTFTYTATDAHGAVSEPSTVTIRVAGTNDAPVAVIDSVSGTEDASVTINVLANDTDVDGETLTITHVNGANIAVNGTVAVGGGASVRLNADGTLTYVPAANANGVQTFSYTVSDGMGGAATSTVEVDLAAVNDAPVAQADTASTDEDTALVLTATSLLANDTDLDGDTLSISSVSAVSERGASVSINAAGDVVYDPGSSTELQALSRGQQVTDTFTYVVTDAAGATSIATVTITVDGQLEAPVANPDTVTVSQNGQASGDVVANDVVTGSTGNSGNVLVNGSFEDGHNVGSGGIGYPASLPGWTSVQGSFEVWGTGFGGNIASDGTAFLELDNGGGQDAYSSNLTTDVGREYTLNFDLAQRNGTSPGSNQVEFLVNGVSLGVFTPPSTTFSTFTVTFIGSGSDVITFREPASANDGVGGLIDNLRIAADADVFVTAVDGDAGLVGQAVDGTNGGEFILQSDGSYAFATAGDFDHLGVGESATTSVTYTVTDDGGSSTTTLTVTVEGENDGPVANNDVVAAVEDQSVTFDVRSNDSDVDGDTLTVTHIEGQAIAVGGTVALTDGGAVKLNANGTLTYTPAANAFGQVDFTYTVADGNGGTANASTTINVAGVADAPVLAVGSSTVLNPTVGSAIQTTVTLAAGDTVSFTWDFVAHDYMPYNDFAFATVNGAAYMLGSVQVVGDYGTTGWQTFTFTATEAGSYSFGVGVSNVNDSSLNSHLLVDNLQVNGVTISSFESGFAGWTTLGGVGVQGAHDGVTPTDGVQMAYLASTSASAAAIESFLGLVPGRLARIAEAAGQQGDLVTVPVSMTLGAGESAEDSYVIITGFPAGSTFNSGEADAASGGWKVPASGLGGNLLIDTPDSFSGSFTLTVVATTFIDETGSSASTAPQTITVTIDPAPAAIVPQGAPLAMASKPMTDAQVLPGPSAEGEVKAPGPQVLPGADTVDLKSDEAQVLPSETGSVVSKDAGAQVLPGSSEAFELKDLGPQVLPPLDDDAFLPMLPVDSGREWAGLMLRVEDADPARIEPTIDADDFLPMVLEGMGPQVLPAETPAYEDALLDPASSGSGLKDVLASWSSDLLKPTGLDADESWYQVPSNDGFQ